MRLLEEQDLTAFEKNITVDEVVAGVRDGSITKVFACGTAAVVTPVERMASTSRSGTATQAP